MTLGFWTEIPGQGEEAKASALLSRGFRVSTSRVHFEGEATTVLIKNNLPSIIGTKLDGDFVRLLPGVNELTEKQWKAFDDLPVIKFHIGEGNIELVEVKAEAKLSDMNAKEAAKLVASTVDKGLLERWAADESRKVVLDAIEKQMDAIAVKTPVDGEDADDETTDEDEA